MKKEIQKDELTAKNILTRITQPTPPFWKKVRKISGVLTAISVALMAAPIALPTAIVTLAGYLALAGTVGVALSSTTI